jgi:Phage integrase, N-terminal SAM-like domain
VRQRGKAAWELRVYRGVDPDCGRQRWLTKTVHGSRHHAQAQLAALVAAADHARNQAGTVGDLLERWFAAASAHWAPSTVRQTRSVINHHLQPHLGHVAVAKLTTADIDDLYGHLPRAGKHNGGPLSPAPYAGSMWCCTGHLPRRCGGSGSGSTPPATPHRLALSQPRFAPPWTLILTTGRTGGTPDSVQ